MIEHESIVLNNEKGTAAIIVAICMIVFLGFTALVVDYGYLAYVQRKLQTAADAAALAGAQEIIYNGDAENVARTYARDNGVLDSDSLAIDVDEEDVRVTISRDVSLFFGPVFGMNTNTRVAKARARVVWVSGLNGLVPFGVTDIRGDVWAGVDGSFTRLTDDNNDSIYGGSLTIEGSGSKSVIIEIRDPVTGAVLRTVEHATAVMIEPTPIKRSNITPNFIKLSNPDTIDVDVSIDGTSTITSVEIEIFGDDHPLSYAGLDVNGDYRFRGSLTPPDVAGTYAVNLKIIRHPGDIPETVGPIDYVRIVDSFSAVGEVSVSAEQSTIFSGESPSLTVSVNGFERGTEYNLKWGQDPESGNFMAVRFDGETGGKVYREHITNGSTTDYMIGDVITTEPGNMPVPTYQALRERISDDTCSWNSDTLRWEDDGGNFHADCPRLVTVPLVGGYMEAHGTYEMTITGFANFFIDSYDTRGNLVGYFVEYPEIGSIWTPEDPGDPLRPRTVRLVPFDS